MSSKQTSIESIINEAQQLRDELALKANLGAAEAKDELAKLNDHYELFKAKSKEIFDVADNSADEIKIAAQLGIEADNKEDIFTALELAAEEIKNSYRKIKELI